MRKSFLHVTEIQIILSSCRAFIHFFNLYQLSSPLLICQNLLQGNGRKLLYCYTIKRGFAAHDFSLIKFEHTEYIYH